MTAKSYLTTVVLALASGVALGVLIAPSSGKKTRRRIRRAAVGMKDNLGYAVLRAEDHLAELRELVEDATGKAVKSAKSAVKA